MKARMRRKRMYFFIRRHAAFAYCDERLARKISRQWSNAERDRKRARKIKRRA